ncbi:MAG: tRNA glutamyl-Q(34) synthetase GluQRS, partial [Myxococcales bacterium]|nr:tRNA glutamyl-Q(34) synthetase GluQRS [Myxococcales bacterium]
PSPTGALHLGHARTFLVAWLRARRAEGEIALRIEDLDPPRTVPGAADAIRRDLEWLGLDWDGEVQFQSTRGDAYRDALHRLEVAGHIYPCTCSRAEIAAVARAPHDDGELGLHYPGTCRRGPSHPERPAAIRFRMPGTPPPFVDGLLGEVDASAWGGDFVVARADGLFAYQLAVVVDDLAQGITEVVRGDDLLSSTPRQIALSGALGAEPPEYLHVPILLGADGGRLAKRDGSLGIGELREAGVSAERVVGALAETLGMPGDPVPAEVLVPLFDLARVPRGRAVMPALLPVG